MDVTLKDIIQSVKELPVDSYGGLYQHIQSLLEEARHKKEFAPVQCVSCGGTHVVRNGKHRGRQAYRCRDCGRTFLHTAESAVAHSHSQEGVWRQVIRDTVDGVSIARTAKHLELSRSTVFRMRHKILLRIQHAIADADIPLDGVHEADETYVLESLKGRRIPEDYYRGPRRHGAVATRRGISNEYICLCTTVDGDNRCTASSVNRAAPSKEEVFQLFGDKVNTDTVILCDGNGVYDTLDNKCTVAHSTQINRVDGFHSFIKERLERARGVATIYLNRYAALFTEVYGKTEAAVEKIYELMTSRSGSFLSIRQVRELDLLEI